MKTKYFLPAILLSVLFLSCSKNDELPTVGSETSPTTFMPLAHKNYWVYNVISQGTTSRDSLYTQNDMSANNDKYSVMETLDTPIGFFSSTLRNNGIKINGSKLQMTGNFTFDFEANSSINLKVTDFTFFDEKAGTNDVLSTISGTQSQNIQGYPLTFDYTLKTICDGSQASLPINTGGVYTEIKKTKVILNMKITSSQTISGFPVTITVMPEQDVLISTQYYSKNIGMVYSKTNINYQLNTIPNVTLPIPSSGNSVQEEFLSKHLLN